VHLPSSNNTLLAHGARQILENTKFVLLCSSMFGIPLFGFILLLIDDWRLVMQVNINQSFFTNPLQQPFHQTFLLAKFFTIRYHFLEGGIEGPWVYLRLDLTQGMGCHYATYQIQLVGGTISHY